MNEKGILHVGVIYLLCPKQLKSNNVFGFVLLKNGTHFNYKHDSYKQYSVKLKKSEHNTFVTQSSQIDDSIKGFIQLWYELHQ